MGDQQSLNGLLQWSIQNSASSPTDPTSQPTHQQRDPSKGLNGKMLAELLGGPSDADRMREAMNAIVAPLEHVDLENKLIAWDNFEQLIEQIDNANNVASMGLWTPLVAQLKNSEPEMRRMAAWCCSTAVQNNIKAQEQLLAIGAIPDLAKLAQEDENVAVRKKAITALSSGVRNYQPALDELCNALPGKKSADAGDMDAVDEIIQKLRDQVPRP